MFEYKVKITRVVDGDTVDVDIDLGFDIILKKQRVRLAGIDTPESRTSDLDEKKYGLKAKQFLIEHLAYNNPNNKVILRTTSYDAKGKFGRILGEFVAFDSVNDRQSTINQLLIDNFHAVQYHGQSKEDIGWGHLQNRKKVKL